MRLAALPKGILRCAQNDNSEIVRRKRLAGFRRLVGLRDWSAANGKAPANAGAKPKKLFPYCPGLLLLAARLTTCCAAYFYLPPGLLPAMPPPASPSWVLIEMRKAFRSEWENLCPCTLALCSRERY